MKSSIINNRNGVDIMDYNCPNCGLVFNLKILGIPKLKIYDLDTKESDKFIYPNYSPDTVICPKCGDDEATYCTEEEKKEYLAEIND